MNEEDIKESSVEVESSVSTPRPLEDAGPTKGGNKKPRKGPLPGHKVSAEVLQRRKEGRIKAAATIASQIKKSGISRVDNDITFSNIKAIPLINQKNYFTDYLKKDDQITFLRHLKEREAAESPETKPKEAVTKKEKVDFDNYDLNDIKLEMNNEDEDDDDDDDDEEGEDGSEEKGKAGSKTIVIHPGSTNFHIGLATDTYPKTIPMVIAIPNRQGTYVEPELNPKREYVDGGVFFDEKFEESKAKITKNFKERMRFYKRRILPNSNETVVNFNKRVQAEKIPDHNDPMKIEWLDKSALYGKKYVVGADALKIPPNDNWITRYPIKDGVFNQQDGYYTVREEILGDLQIILTETLVSEFQIEKKQLPNHNAVLIIQDLYDKSFVENWIQMLLGLGFDRVAIIQESVGATFGAGVSSACVIDIGASTTKISCVDDGMVINDSRVRLNYGGDDVTKTFIKMLLQSYFPYEDINLSNIYDWELAETLKKNFVTFQDVEIAIQLYNFYKRVPNEQTEKYEFKTFDEVMLSPMGLFYPEVFQKKKALGYNKKLFSPSVDQYTSKPNNPYSKSQDNLNQGINFVSLTDKEIIRTIISQINLPTQYKPVPEPTDTNPTTNKNLTPLDIAIIESVTNACKNDLSKFKKIYENLLIVGGGSKISGLDLILTDRINIWRPKILSSQSVEEIMDHFNGLKIKLDKEKDQFLSEASKNGKEVDKQETEERFKVKIDQNKVSELIEGNDKFIGVEILPNPRDIDPQVLVWKGGSVFARLKIVNELWISHDDWSSLGNRSLHYSSLFNY